MNELRKDVSQTLKTAIIKSNKTNVAVGDVIGVSPQMVSAYLKGVRRLSLENELKLLEYFGYKFEIGEPDATTV